MALVPSNTTVVEQPPYLPNTPFSVRITVTQNNISTRMFTGNNKQGSQIGMLEQYIIDNACS